ncbi:efflux RND transporter periplasmic adaptor subunit [Pedobacter immunditicola]|uniref:efflux RND transporter periplasmic adaptor subunit n=1 Tax=Pedobacter immunditicola TaxID=3133440 RepID=UPI0030AFDF87
MNLGINRYKSRIHLLFLLPLVVFASCTNSSAPNEAEEEHEEGAPELALSKAQMDAVGITLGKIELKNLKDVVKANGQLEVPPQNKAQVHPLIGGVISKIFVLEGNYVRKGQTLVTLENPDVVQVQQDYLASKSNLSFATKEYERQKELMAAKAGTGKVYQQAEANYFTEQSRFKALQSQLKQIGISVESLDKGSLVTKIAVRAPINGVVGHIQTTTGSYADTSSPLMTITDNSQIHCDLLVYEKDLFKVKKGQKVDFILTNQNNQQISGTIYGINKTFENESKAVITHAKIDNSSNKNLIPGMYVSALINVGNQTTNAVPVGAVINGEGKSYIFIIDHTPEKEQHHKEAESEREAGEHYRFKKIEVVTGVSDLGYIEIKPLTEIPKDAVIITKGAFYIQSMAAGGGGDHH